MIATNIWILFIVLISKVLFVYEVTLTDVFAIIVIILGLSVSFSLSSFSIFFLYWLTASTSLS